jgi:hypothetical protein
MESWRTAFRLLADRLTDNGLAAVERALQTDDPRLLQLATVYPPPAAYDGCERQALAGDPIAFAGMADMPGASASKVAVYCEQGIESAEQAGCITGEFLRRWDDSERSSVRRQLLPEVKRAIAMRTAQVPAEA